MANIGALKIGLGLDTTGLVRDLRRSEFLLNKQAAKFKALGSTLTSSLTLPLVGIGAASTKLAVDLSKNFGKIENLVGVTGGSLESLRTGVASVSNTVAKSQGELSDALFAVTSAGIRGDEAIQILTQSAKASQIGLGDTKSIALATTAVMNAYGKENINAARATDILTSIVREGNLEAESLAPTLGRVVGLASQMGISFEEVGANIATFTRLGVNAEEAVTALRGIMANFLKPTKEVKDVLAEVGLTADGVRDKIGKQGLARTLVDLIQVYDGNVESLGKLVPNIRALSGVLGTAGSQGEEYIQIAQNIANSTGIVDKGFNNVSKGSGFQFQALLVQLQNAGIQLGTKLLPYVLKAVSVVTDLVSKFSSLSSSTQDNIVKYALLAAAIGPTLTIMGKMIGVVATLKGVFAGLIPTVIKFGAALTGPIGIAMLAIAGGAALIVKNWDAVRTATVKVVNEVITLYNESILVRGILEGIAGYFEISSVIVKGLFKNLKEVGGILGKIISLDFDGLSDSMTLAALNMTVTANETADDISRIFKERVNNVIDPKELMDINASDVDALVAPLVNGFNNLKNELSGAFDFGGGGGGGGAAAPVAAAASQAVTIGPKISPDLQRVLPELNTELTKLAEFDGENFNTMQERMGGLRDVSMQLAEIIETGLKDSFGTLGESLGAALVNADSFGAGLKSVLSSVADTMLGVLTQVGKLAISTGIAVEGIKLALGALNPAAAIAGGVALIALASVVKSKLANSVPKLAKGGVLTGETLFIGGEYPGASNNPEIVTPQNILAETFRKELGRNGGGGGGQGVLHMDTIRFGLASDNVRVS